MSANYTTARRCISFLSAGEHDSPESQLGSLMSAINEACFHHYDARSGSQERS